MEVRTAKTAGFCFGVKRAVATVYEEIKNGKDGRAGDVKRSRRYICHIFGLYEYAICLL